MPFLQLMEGLPPPLPSPSLPSSAWPQPSPRWEANCFALTYRLCWYINLQGRQGMEINSFRSVMAKREWLGGGSRGLERPWLSLPHVPLAGHHPRTDQTSTTDDLITWQKR